MALQNNYIRCQPYYPIPISDSKICRIDDHWSFLLIPNNNTSNNGDLISLEMMSLIIMHFSSNNLLLREITGIINNFLMKLWKNNVEINKSIMRYQQNKNKRIKRNMDYLLKNIGMCEKCSNHKYLSETKNFLKFDPVSEMIICKKCYICNLYKQ